MSEVISKCNEEHKKNELKEFFRSMVNHYGFKAEDFADTFACRPRPECEVKHKPHRLSPLPWVDAGDLLIRDKDGYRVTGMERDQKGFRLPEDRSYVVHAANAYPRLVVMLRQCLCAAGSRSSIGVDASGLLHELGEGA